jgi:hypothetical protein
LLTGEAIPYWAETVAAARRCSAALDLGYVGVDLVIDAERGVQVLECNAYPGLEIQNINGAGLGSRIDAVLRQRRARERAERRAGEAGRFTGTRPLQSFGKGLSEATSHTSARLSAMLAGPALAA